MHFGASNFFTDYSIAPGELALALEARGFETVWAAEHSHIPTSRRSPYPGGDDRLQAYHDVMDPFVTLTAAALATRTLKVGTGVCPVNQRATRFSPPNWWHRSKGSAADAFYPVSAGMPKR